MLILTFYDAEQRASALHRLQMLKCAHLWHPAPSVPPHAEVGTGIIDLSWISKSAFLLPPPLKPGGRPGRVNIPGTIPAKTKLQKKK